MTDAPGASAEPPEVFIVLDALDFDKAAALRYRCIDRLEQYVVLVPLKGAVGSALLDRRVIVVRCRKEQPGNRDVSRCRSLP